MKRKAGTFDRIVAGVLTVTLAGLYFVPATASASTAPAVSAPVSTHAEICGNVLGADGLTTIAGVSVKAANMVTHAIYTSDSTGADGQYKLRDLPPGSYDLAVQTPQGLFAADALVEARAGHRNTVSLALHNHPSLPEATRRRIQELARAMGYRPNPTISTLMRQVRARLPN